MSLPIPLQVHMCFISRQAHQTVNSNGVLAWGYVQPEVEKEVSQKKNDSQRGNHLCLVLPFAWFPEFYFIFPFLKYLVVSQCFFPLHIPQCNFSLVQYIVYFQLWFACKFFLVLYLSVSYSCVSAALPLSLPSLHLLSFPPHFISFSVSVKLCFVL